MRGSCERCGVNPGKDRDVQVFSSRTPKADWPLPAENSSISLRPELPTRSDTPRAVSDSAAPGASQHPRGQGEAASAPSPAPLRVNRGPRTPGYRREQGVAHEGRGPGPVPMASRTGLGAEGHLPILALLGKGSHAASGPVGPARAWLPPISTRGQYLRAHGRDARPAAAGNTSTMRSWPEAGACNLHPPPLLPAARWVSRSSAPPRARPAPGPSHVGPQRFKNNFIGSFGLHVRPPGQVAGGVPMATGAARSPDLLQAPN